MTEQTDTQTAPNVTGVTKQELEETADTLEHFASTSVDEFGGVDDWICVSYRAIQRLLEEREQPRSTVPLVREELDSNQLRTLQPMNSTNCVKERCEKESTTTIRYPSTGELQSYCDKHIRELMMMRVPFEGTANPEQ